MKRGATDAQLRDIVRARITKGSAFNHTKAEYDKLQAETKAKLDAMWREDIFKEYPYATYDLIP